MPNDAYSGQLSRRSTSRNLIELFEHAEGYIEAEDNIWPRCICFDLGGNEGISLCYASNADSLNSSDKSNIRRVLNGLIDMDNAAWFWSDHQTVDHHHPWLSMALIDGNTVCLRYGAMAMNTNWEVEFEIHSDGSWQPVRHA